MKGRIVSGVLAVIGILTWSVTGAQAGGGQGGALFNNFFECQAVNGANVGEIVSTHLPLSGPGTGTTLHGNVKVGNAVLVCRQVDVVDSGNPPAIINGGRSSTDLKCYSVTTPGRNDAAVVEGHTDDFGTENVIVYDPPRLLCGPVSRTTPTP